MVIIYQTTQTDSHIIILQLQDILNWSLGAIRHDLICVWYCIVQKNCGKILNVTSRFHF